MNEPEVMERMLDLDGGPSSMTRRVIAVVGLSDDPLRPSYRVSQYMQHAGYRILPVNPSIHEVLGERSFASLKDLPMKPDVVNVFRLPKAIPGIVDEMIALGMTNLWVQQGIVNREAAETAEAAGIAVVMDRCIMVEHARLERMRVRS